MDTVQFQDAKPRTLCSQQWAGQPSFVRDDENHTEILTLPSTNPKPDVCAVCPLTPPPKSDQSNDSKSLENLQGHNGQEINALQPDNR